jgi:hypothetical protein
MDLQLCETHSIMVYSQTSKTTTVPQAVTSTSGLDNEQVPEECICSLIAKHCKEIDLKALLILSVGRQFNLTTGKMV